jgi:hypothetical protein
MQTAAVSKGTDMLEGSGIRRSLRLGGAALVASVALIVVAGCGSSSSKSKPATAAKTPATSTSPTAAVTFTVARLESTPKSSLNSTTGPPLVGGGFKITSVSCLRSIQPAANKSVQCSVQGTYGLTGTVSVTFANAAGTKLRYDATLQSGDVRQGTTGTATLS